MKKGGFLIYIRTSTVKQGTEGVSLEVQEREAMNLARQKGLLVREVVSEMETAAKRGRPRFTRIMKELLEGKADGLILHKIDRGARNLRDWSDITDLIEQGIKVYIVHDSVDLHSRGGRLAGDMLAAVAADYVRNLREETKKGLIGRLKQGLWPFSAPVGYLDQGGGKTKTVDPVKGPLVVKAFELYATGSYSFDTLREKLDAIGLRTSAGSKLSRNGLTVLFNNTFYIGLMKLRSTGELFPGVHEKLIPQSLFDQVQDVLHGRVNRKSQVREYAYRRTIACASCTYKLTGETQKGHVYYRCHDKECPSTSFREERISEILENDLLALLLFVETYAGLVKVLEDRIAGERSNSGLAIAALRMKQTQIEARQSAAVDAVIDGLIDKDTFVRKKNELVRQRMAIDEQIARLDAGQTPGAYNANTYCELVKDLRSKSFLKSPYVALSIAKRATANFSADGKNLSLKWDFPFQQAIEHAKSIKCGLQLDTLRTLDEWADLIMGKQAASSGQTLTRTGNVEVPTSPCPEDPQDSPRVGCIATEERMATYTVHYEMRKGSSSVGGSKTVNAETEATAVRIAQDQAKAHRPVYDFVLKRVDKK